MGEGGFLQIFGGVPPNFRGVPPNFRGGFLQIFWGVPPNFQGGSPIFGIRSTFGRYASYWNALLLICLYFCFSISHTKTMIDIVSPQAGPRSCSQFIELYEDELSKGISKAEHMSCEMLRMNSFKHRPDSYKGVWPSHLARAGLYYDPRSEATICFACVFRKPASFWVKGRNPFHLHRIESPNCRYITGDIKDNVPFHTRYQRTNKLSYLEPNSSANKPAPSQGTGHPGRLVADPPFTALPVTQEFNSFTIEARPRNRIREQSHYQQSTSEVHSSQPVQQMRSEEARLMTYKRWPSHAAVSPQDLARAGFFYTGNADRVQCAFCHHVFRNWEPGDNPTFEHKRHFPRCPFVLGDVENVPISYETRLQGMKDEEHRLMTFTRWPKDFAIAPQNLARAGFFYTGTDDQVQCAFCEKTLMNWDHGDDPMTEHWKHVPKCPFVLQYDVGNIPIPHEERTRARVFIYLYIFCSLSCFTV